MKASSWAVLCFQAAQAANQTRNARAHIKPSKRWWEFLPVSPNPWHFIQAPDSILLSKIDYQILICRYKGWILIVIPAQKEGDPVGPCGGFCSPLDLPISSCLWSWNSLGLNLFSMGVWRAWPVCGYNKLSGFILSNAVSLRVASSH